MRPGWKKVSAAVMAVVMVLGMQMSAFAAAKNPFALQGTDISKLSKEFTVKLKVPDKVQMDAYQVSIEYDTSVLAVKGGEGTGYQYTKAFSDQYKDGGLLVAHSLPELGKVNFAGATANAASASFEGEFARITFTILDKSKAVEDVLTDLKVKVDTLTLADMVVDVTGMEDSYPVTFNGIIMGDVNGDSSVDLADANMVLKAALKIIPLTEDQKKAADVDGKSGVDLADANMVLKAALKIITL